MTGNKTKIAEDLSHRNQPAKISETVRKAREDLETK